MTGMGSGGTCEGGAEPLPQAASSRIVPENPKRLRIT